MPISLSNSRNDFVEISLLTDQRKLVLYQRMADDGNAIHGLSPSESR